MVRMLPMFITGVVCNGIIALIIGRVDVLYIIGMFALRNTRCYIILQADTPIRLA